MNSVLLLGNPVSRSLSPVMQNAAFEALGIDCHYALRELRPAELATAMADLRADDRILGANVTIPHKESVIAFLDDLDPLARRIGAVNTISRQRGRLKGWNTDVEGFRRALDEQISSPARAVQTFSSPARGVQTFPSPARGGGQGGGGLRVAIIGAGGAARAVAAALQPAAEVWVIARNLEQSQRLYRDLEILRGGPVDVRQMEQPVGGGTRDVAPSGRRIL